MLYASRKIVKYKYWVKPKKERKPDKKTQSTKINIEKEIETMRGEMSILSKIERNKDPKNKESQESYKTV